MDRLKVLGLGLTLTVVTAPLHLFVSEQQPDINGRGYTASEFNTLVINQAKQVFPKPHHIVLRAHKVMEAKNKRAFLTHSF